MKKKVIIEKTLLTSDNIADVINDYETKYKEGFIHYEILELLKTYNINSHLFFENLGINTALMIDGDCITFHCDIETALFCCIENRGKNLSEWD